MFPQSVHSSQSGDSSNLIKDSSPTSVSGIVTR